MAGTTFSPSCNIRHTYLELSKYLSGIIFHESFPKTAQKQDLHKAKPAETAAGTHEAEEWSAVDGY